MASQHHIVIFPFLAQGHTLPILDLSKALSCRGLKVTIITTPSNSPFIRLIISRYPEIHLREISFPLVEALPKGCENTAQLPSMDLLLPFLTATKQLQQPFEQALRDMSQVQDLPICVISDSYLGWTNTSCRAFNIPRLVFHGMGAFSMAVRKSLLAHQTHKHKSNTEPLCVPGVRLDFQLTKTDLPKSLREMDYDNPLSRFHLEAEESDLESWGVIINSFTELEKDHIASLESFYKNGAKAWCVGPFLLYEETMEGKEDPSRTWVEWLINKGATEKSVIYMSFGSQIDLSHKQLDEVAFGLEMSEHGFIWVVRSRTWNPPSEIEKKMMERGLIVREWVDQRRILAHKAIGGFLSHCGWNSVLESLSMGVPILAWPMVAEQHLNAKFLVEELKVAEQVPIGTIHGEENIIRREVICEGVRELMGGEKGRKAREKAEELGKMGRRAVQEGGSSYGSLNKLIDQLHDICR